VRSTNTAPAFFSDEKPVSEARLLLWEQWVGDCFDRSVDESLKDFKGHTQQRYRTIALWVPQWLLWLWDRNYDCASPDLWNFEFAHAGIKEVVEPSIESRPGVEYELREDEVQSRRFSWLQTSDSSSKLFRPEGFGDTVTLRCWNLPQVGQLLVDEPGGLAVASLVCPVLHQLRSERIRHDGAHAGGASRPASKFVDGAPRPAAGVREVDGVDSFLPSLLLLLL